MPVLVVNAGSSSLKLSLLDDDDAVLSQAQLAVEHGAVDRQQLAAVLEGAEVAAVGHRIVHGGSELVAPVVVDRDVLAKLKSLADLAPLHQPPALATLEAVSRALPEVPAVACFDTAFHATLPPAASTYALPASWRERWPLRRYGFHGLSHAYAARRAAEMIGVPAADLRIVSCHLGAGASLAAVAGGRSVDTTMGFTPLEGLVMATRCGSIDPGLPLWLVDRGLSAREVDDALEHRSGLAGLAGTRDMRAVLERATAGDADAGLALDVYLHRLSAGMASMAAAMGGLDVLLYTGGVGEHAPLVRQRAADRLAFLGLRIDETRNATAQGDAEIGADGAPVRALVVAAREDLEIAHQVRQLLTGATR